MFSCAEVAALSGEIYARIARSVCRRCTSIIGWPVSHCGGKQSRDAVSFLAGRSEREGTDGSSSHVCVLAAPTVDTGKRGEQMSEAQRTRKEMKEEITEEGNVVCLPVASV